MDRPIRIFVGCPGNNEDLEAQAVLAWSLRKHHQADELSITWMMLSRDPESFWYSDPQRGQGWRTDGWATPFSALRWGIPAACDYQGRAIYMDSDQIAMADIAELWEQPIPNGKALLGKGLPDDLVSCVLLFDCAAMRMVLPSIKDLKYVPGKYKEIRKATAAAAANYSGDWNCRDSRDLPRYKSIHDPNIKVLHYTDIPTQPNHKHARARLKREGKPHWFAGPDRPHPRPELNRLFDELLAEATAAGYGPEHYRVSPEFGDYGPMKSYGRKAA